MRKQYEINVEEGVSVSIRDGKIVFEYDQTDKPVTIGTIDDENGVGWIVISKNGNTRIQRVR